MSAGSGTTDDEPDSLVERVRINDWDSFHRYYREHLSSHRWLFRGQGYDWPLSSPLEREFASAYGADSFDGVPPSVRGILCSFSEQHALDSFRQRAHLFHVREPKVEHPLEWLAFLQHHGSQTRLLDWTFSVFVAVFFALERFYKAPVVWCVDWRELWKSACDKVSGGSQTNSVAYPVPPPPPTASLRTVSTHLVGRFPRLTNTEIDAVVPFTPAQMFERLLMQQGAFLVPLTLNSSFESALVKTFSSDISHKPLKKLILLPNRRFEFMRELSRMNITRATLFPGLEGLSGSLIAAALTEVVGASLDKVMEDGRVPGFDSNEPLRG